MPSFLKYRKKSNGKQTSIFKMKPTMSTLKKIMTNPELMYDVFEDFLFNPNLSFYVMTALLPLELILNIGIVLNIKCNKKAFIILKLSTINT